MYLTEVFGSFSDLQKFSSINKPEEIAATGDSSKNLTTTLKVSAEVTSGGWRMATIAGREENGFGHVYSWSSRVPLQNLGQGVSELIRRGGLYPKEPGSLRFEWPTVMADVQHFAARISELYTLTDQQLEAAPIHTRAICWLTNNPLFPEYRLRRSLEAYAAGGQ